MPGFSGRAGRPRLQDYSASTDTPRVTEHHRRGNNLVNRRDPAVTNAASICRRRSIRLSLFALGRIRRVGRHGAGRRGWRALV